MAEPLIFMGIPKPLLETIHSILKNGALLLWSALLNYGIRRDAPTSTLRLVAARESSKRKLMR